MQTLIGILKFTVFVICEVIGIFLGMVFYPVGKLIMLTVKK